MSRSRPKRPKEQVSAHSAAVLADDAGSSSPHARTRLALFAWCLYDWANSSFSTIIVTFIFPAYFARAVAASPEQGAALWGRALAISGLLAAVSAPVLGAIADRAGRRKPWLGTFTAVSVVATAMLWFTAPSPDSALWAVWWTAIAGAAFEAAGSFYNAMLPDLAPPERLGRASGWAWGLGYAGGLAALLVALWLISPSAATALGLDTAHAEPVRATTVLVAAWFAVFSLPLFFFTPDRPATGITAREAALSGVETLRSTLAHLPKYGHVGRFLVAHMIYADALATLFAFGGVYAAGTFGMSTEEIIRFGIVLNVAAGIGAAAFAWVDDFVGAKPTIAISLVVLSLVTLAMLVATSAGSFWVLATMVGVFVGPAQAASRSYMARIAPVGLEAEMFGLFALSGKATAFVGPWMVSLLTTAFASQRYGMAVIPAFLLMGLGLLLTVKR